MTKEIDLLETLNQRLSYIVGENMATQLKNDGLELNTDALVLAVNDVMAGDKSRLTEEVKKSTVEEIQKLIGADWLVYQDLEDLIKCAKEGNEHIENFDCSVFNGVYPTGDISPDYLQRLEAARNDSNKQEVGEDDAPIDLHNDI